MKKVILQYLGFFVILSFFTFGFALYKATGKKIDLSLLEGLSNTAGSNLLQADYRHKSLVVYFWATWCSVCQLNNPILKFNYALISTFSNLKFISLEEGAMEIEALKKFTQELKLNYPVYKATPKIFSQWGITGFPTTFFINHQGEVKFIDTGIINPLSFYLRILFL